MCSSSQDGRTALYLSAAKGHMDVVTELLERGANVVVTTKVRVECVVHVVRARESA